MAAKNRAALARMVGSAEDNRWIRAHSNTGLPEPSNSLVKKAAVMNTTNDDCQGKGHRTSCSGAAWRCAKDGRLEDAAGAVQARIGTNTLAIESAGKTGFHMQGANAMTFSI